MFILIVVWGLLGCDLGLAGFMMVAVLISGGWFGWLDLFIAVDLGMLLYLQVLV